MSAPLLLFVGAIYCLVAVGYWRDERPGMAVALVAYALANMGLAWDAWR